MVDQIRSDTRAGKLRAVLYLVMSTAFVTAIGCNSVPRQPTPCDTCPDRECKPVEPEQALQASDSVDLDESVDFDEYGEAGMTVRPVAHPINETLGMLPFEDGTSELVDVGAPEELNEFMPPPVSGPAEQADELREPSIAGAHLGALPMTANEHALRLQRENELLRITRESVFGDNQRLRDQLKATEDLLARIKVAMIDAKDELENAAKANRELKQQIVDIEREHKRSKSETDRLLGSIRGELDDVLMREMAREEI
jgi:hypothetical protein